MNARNSTSLCHDPDDSIDTTRGNDVDAESPIRVSLYSPAGTPITTVEVKSGYTFRELHVLVALATGTPEEHFQLIGGHGELALGSSLVHRFLENDADITFVKRAPDSIVTASGDGFVHIWSARRNKCIRRLVCHASSVRSVAYSKDGTRIVTGSADHSSKVWDVVSGTCLHTLVGHADIVCAVDISHDTKWVLTASEDSTAKIWDMQTGDCTHTFKERHVQGITCAKFSPDGSVIAISSAKGVSLWNCATGCRYKKLRGFSEPVSTAVFSSDGLLVLTASWDYSANIWVADTGECSTTFVGHTGSIEAASFSHDDSLVATASADSTARVWDSVTADCLLVLIGHVDFVHCVAFSPDDEWVVTTSDDRTARLWSARTGESVRIFGEHNNSVWCASFCPSYSAEIGNQ
eukprot:TRINITY_DN28747_c0_g1_i1.p1 TRINITY_DN28747_c0_g1~~TRINITY_DN28747_c0_g1_i1.p1  ORF type:complete len:417 (-),score=33.58 TRINITY_DN28747_c0_g1_i1:606-1826(-)